MPVTKLKHIRHYALNRCFRNKSKRYYIEDLLQECNKDLLQHDCKPISLRTIKNDLNEFEELYNTIVEHLRDRNGRVYYRYANPDFSIQNAPLSEDDLAKLKETVLILKCFRGMPQFGWMDDILTKIQTKLHIEGHTEHIISFECNDDIKGLEFIESLFDYIINCQAIDITYQPFSKPITHYTISPYHIKQFNTRWFLFGNIKEKQIVNLALDRIVSIKPSTQRYIPNTTIDFTEYFEDVIGVTIPNTAIETILLHFTPHRLPYVLSKPLHSSQRVKNREQGLVEIQVKPNNELYALLLNFGEDVEVIAPTYIREKIKELVKKMYYLYFECK